MSTPTFYQSEYCHEHTEITLNSREAAHALKARRLRIGDAICVLNGRGLRADCTISQVSRNTVIALVEQCIEIPEKPVQLTIASAIPKRDRQRTMVDMLTQLGVSRIIPLECERSVTRYKESMQEKWQRYAIEACKQSQNPWAPEIAAGTGLAELFFKLGTNAVFWTTDFAGKKLVQLTAESDHVVIIIGPEGGFSEQELLLMDSKGVAKLRLADHILRTELAAVAASAQFFNR